MKLLKLIILIVTLFVSCTAETNVLFNTVNLHYNWNYLLNNNNDIVAVQKDNIVVMHMINSFYRESYGVFITTKFTKDIEVGIGACSGYDDYIVYNPFKGDYDKCTAPKIYNDIALQGFWSYDIKINDKVKIKTLMTPANISSFVVVNID